MLKQKYCAHNGINPKNRLFNKTKLELFNGEQNGKCDMLCVLQNFVIFSTFPSLHCHLLLKYAHVQSQHN